MKESVKESTTKWAEIKTTVSAYRDLSNNKGFQTKEWLPQEIMSKKYPTESLNEKWKRNLGDSDKLAFSNLFSKDILIFIILGFSGRKRTTLCQLLIKKKRNGQDKMRIWEVLKVLWFQPETVGRFRKMLLCTQNIWRYISNGKPECQKLRFKISLGLI